MSPWMTPQALFDALLRHPSPPYTVPPRLTLESTHPRQCLIRMNGSEVHYDGARWTAYDWNLPAELPADATPEQISAELERVRTFWTQHSNITDASVWKRKAQELESTKRAAHDYISRLEQALLVLKIEPSAALDVRDAARAYAKGRADEQAMLDKAHEQRDAAQTRMDTLRAEINGILTKLGVSPVEGPEMRAKGIAQVCEESNALRLIAEHLGLSKLDPDAVRRRVQLDAADLKVARERVVKVEGLLGEECARGDSARHALNILGIIGDDPIGQAKRRAQLDAERNENSARRAKELEVKHDTEINASSTVNTSLMRQIKKAHEALDAAGIPRSAEEDGEPGSPWTLGQRIAVLLTPGDDESPAEWAINEIDKILHPERPRPFACDLDKFIAEVKSLNADVTAVWELWGCGREVKPGALHELCQEQERLNTDLRTEIGAVTEHLDNAGIPTHYGHDQKGNPVPFVERAALLAEAYKDAVWMQNKWHDGVMNAAAESTAAHDALNELGAPRRAGDLALGLAARIRSIPGLPRP